MITCDVCGHVNPDGLQYCENCGVELKKSAPATPAPTASTPQTNAPEAPVSVPYASDTPTLTDSSLTSSAPATAQVLEAASQTPAETVGGKVAAMVEEPVMAAVPAATEGAVINAPDGSSATPANAMGSTPVEHPPLEMPPLELAAPEQPPLETPPLEEVMSEAAATGTVSSVSSEPVPAQDVHPTALPSSMGGELPDAPVSSTPPNNAQPMIPVPADMSQSSSAPTPTSSSPASSSASDSVTPTPAKLGVKKFGALTGDTIPLMGSHLIVGRFDPSTGPVEIDVSSLPGAEHISRRHAEIYFEDGVWKVRDLGSTNGVFVKKAGEAAFSPRLQTPMTLGGGDELAFGNMVLVFLVD